MAGDGPRDARRSGTVRRTVDVMKPKNRPQRANEATQQFEILIFVRGSPLG